MRRLTLEQIEAKIANQSSRIDASVTRFRGKTKQEGWSMKRTRPRNPDEIKALNYIARRSLRMAMKAGTVRYDKERRVLLIANYSRSEA